ncbi:hypothetical protein [Flavobacterium araucananum]|nr:hypothetical protein [Flavobacterium araucananum]
MSQSLSKVYVHLVFSTKGRFPFIDHNIQESYGNTLAEFVKDWNAIQFR